MKKFLTYLAFSLFVAPNVLCASELPPLLEAGLSEASKEKVAVLDLYIAEIESNQSLILERDRQLDAWARRLQKLGEVSDRQKSYYVLTKARLRSIFDSDSKQKALLKFARHSLVTGVSVKVILEQNSEIYGPAAHVETRTFFDGTTSHLIDCPLFD